MVIAQGDIWWAYLPDPVGSGPGYRRPVVIVQSDSFNRSGIATVLCVPLTGKSRWGGVPGTVSLPSSTTGLPRDSVANASQTTAVDRRQLIEWAGRVTARQLDQVFDAIDAVLGR